MIRLRYSQFKTPGCVLEGYLPVTRSDSTHIYRVITSYLRSPKNSIRTVKFKLMFNLCLLKYLIMIHYVAKAIACGTGNLKRPNVFVNIKERYDQKCLYRMLIMSKNLIFLVLKNPFRKQIFNLISICVSLKAFFFPSYGKIYAYNIVNLK